MSNTFSQSVHLKSHRAEEKRAYTRKIKGTPATKLMQAQAMIESFQRGMQNKISEYEPFQLCNTPHASILEIEKLEPMSITDLRFETVMSGNFLLCQTIVDSHTRIVLHTAIEDRHGNCMQLNCSHLFNENMHTLAKGTIMLIKEPLMTIMQGTEPTIYCSAPTDVVIIDTNEDLHQEIWKGVQWKTAIERAVTHRATTALECKDRGNVCFAAKEYTKSMNLYTAGIEFAVKEENATLLNILHLNRAASKIQLQSFASALADVEILLNAKPDIPELQLKKALNRAGRAAYLNRQYHLAKGYFEALLAIEDSVANQIELNNCDKRIAEETTGVYDLAEMLLKSKSNIRLDHANYTGPIEVADTEEVGKGIFATKDIKPGTLLLACKADEFASPRDVARQDVYAKVFSTYDKCSQIETIPRHILKTRVYHRVLNDPVFAAAFQSLSSVNPADNTSYSRVAINKESIFENGVIRSDSILRIIQSNIITAITPDSLASPDTEEKGDQSNCSFGIWLPASRFNHACTSNAHLTCIADMLFVRNKGWIKEGEQITISYHTNQNIPIDVQERFGILYGAYGFRCECAVCRTDREGQVEHDVRIGLNEEFKVFHQNYSGDTTRILAKGSQIIKKMKKSYEREGRETLRFALEFVMKRTGYVTRSIGESVEAVEFVLKACAILGIPDMQAFVDDDYTVYSEGEYLDCGVLHYLRILNQIVLNGSNEDQQDLFFNAYQKARNIIYGVECEALF